MSVRTGKAPQLDGALAASLLTVWSLFVPSVCFLICCVPYLIFDRAIGWQPSHGAIWLGALSVAPISPALRGLLATAHATVEEKGYPGHLVRRFLSAVRAGSPALKGAWCLAPVVTLLLAYDVVVSSPGTRALVVAVGITLVLLLVGVSCADRAGQRASDLLLVVLGSAARRPHIPVTWLFLICAAMGVAVVPLVGPSLLLLIPATWGAAVDIVNRTWGFFPTRP
jgi:hypothetical protein